MKLYVCYGTFKAAPRPGGHPCGVAHDALREAGYEPEVIRSYGLGLLPDFLNPTRGRREVRELTGSTPDLAGVLLCHERRDADRRRRSIATRRAIVYV